MTQRLLSILLLLFSATGYTADSEPGYRSPQIRQRLIDGPCDKRNSLGMFFCDIPHGTFNRGAPANTPSSFGERPQHQVTLTQDFEIMATEMTWGLWDDVMKEDSVSGPDVLDVAMSARSWNEITYEFLPKLNEMLSNEGYTYRLPTDAEWEYAARGGKTGPYGIDGELETFAWTRPDNTMSRTHKVAQLRSNLYGLFDMHGNVWEWVQDLYCQYTADAVTNPLMTEANCNVPDDPRYKQKTHRGGGIDSSLPSGFRVTFRNQGYPSDKNVYVGFRLVRTRK